MLQTNDSLQNGRYRIIQQLEKSETNIVYKAVDRKQKIDVLITQIPIKLKKVMTLAQQESLRNEFALEAENLKRIVNDNFLQVHDYFSEIDRHYLVLESFDGISISTQNGAIEFEKAIKWSEQLIEVLSSIHRLTPPIFHLEINPQKIKSDAHGNLKLLPPCVSKNSSENKETQDLVSSTIQYLPIEQILNNLDSASQKVITNSYDEKSERILKQSPDQRSDIYSLGAVLYLIFTGQNPIDALERSIELLDGKPDPLISPNRINRNIPVEISDFLMKALELRRENRFDSAAIMRQFLRTALIRMKERESTPEADLLQISQAVNPISKQELPAETNAPAKVETNVLKTQSASANGLTKPLTSEFSEEPIPTLPTQLPATQSSELQPNTKKLSDSELEEQKKQLEILKNQLREAEEKRIQAEQRTAEIELLLLEKKVEAVETDNSKIEAEEFSQESFAAEIELPETFTQNNQDKLPDEFSEMFSEMQKEKTSSWKIPAFALVFLLIGGGVFGFWYSNKQTEASPAVTEQINPANNPANNPPIVSPTSDPTSVSTEIKTVENPAETVTAPENTNPNVETPANETKKKAVVPIATPKVKKTAPPVQTAANEKKKVTVDDLINDN